jgi:hypothetical protein
MAAALCAAAVVTVAPAAAQADPVGPAYFARAGGSFFPPIAVHSDGLKVYATSPAYIVLRTHTVAEYAIERYAFRFNFPWVAVRDRTLGHDGMFCFSDAHLILFPFFVSDFTDDFGEWHGLFLQYATRSFLPGEHDIRRCALVRAAGPVEPSVELTATSAKFHLDCLRTRCRGSLLLFRSGSATPVVSRAFSLAGGRSANVELSLGGLRPADLLVAIMVSGRRRLFERLTMVSRASPAPSKPEPTSMTVSCPSGGTSGVPATISGALVPGGSPARVTISYSGATTTIVSNAVGSFTAQVTPGAPGPVTLSASFIGDRQRTAASASCSFPVSKPQGSLAVQCPTTARVGSPASISGAITPAAAGATVTLAYTPPTGSAVTHTQQTDGNGAFMDPVPTLEQNRIGQWSVRASWPGDVTIGGASATCNFTVSPQSAPTRTDHYSQRNVRGASRIRMIRAGMPAATALSGMSRVTTAFVPITALSPIVTPRSTHAP